MASGPEFEWRPAEGFKWLCLCFLGMIGMFLLLGWCSPADPNAAAAPPSAQLPAR